MGYLRPKLFNSQYPNQLFGSDFFPDEPLGGLAEDSSEADRAGRYEVGLIKLFRLPSSVFREGNGASFEAAVDQETLREWDLTGGSFEAGSQVDDEAFLERD